MIRRHVKNKNKLYYYIGLDSNIVTPLFKEHSQRY